MQKHRFRRVMAATLAALGVAALGLTAPSAHAASADPLVYAALGDSYSAGSGVSPLELGSGLCARSQANYPKVIASRTGAQLTDVTCGGAQTVHFTEAQYALTPPQIEALGPDTDLVTMTIGGNDNSTFVSSLLTCGSAGLLSGGQGSPCKDQNGSRFEDEIRNSTYPALKAALQRVRTEAPHARVAILGYPWILPPTTDTSCFLKTFIASGDVAYMRGVQATLNAVIERAADETGATFVDFSQVSEGHDACRPSGTRWIEPVVLGNSLIPVHPNALGESRMADEAMRTLGLG